MVCCASVSAKSIIQDDSPDAFGTHGVSEAIGP